MKRIINLFLITALTSNIYAAVPAENKPAPDPNYATMFPSLEEQTKNAGKLITEDELHQDNISGSFGYESNMGSSFYKRVTGENGRQYTIDTRNGQEVDLKEKTTSQNYQDKLNSIQKVDTTKSASEQNKEKLQNLKEAKKERNKELEDKNYSAKQMENQFVHGTEPYAAGSAILNSTFLQPVDNTNATEDEINSANYYQNNFGFDKKQLNKETVSSQNAGKLKQAYKMFDEFEATQRSKMSAASIQCYISRELIPQYYCPMNGRQGTKFGGDNLTTEAEAKKDCNKNCQEPRQCVGSKVLETTNITLSTTTKSIFPYTEESKLIESEDLSRSMLIDYLSYDIEVLPSSEFKGTTEEFDKWLKTSEIKFRYSIIKKDTAVNNPNQLLLDREVKTIKGMLSSVKTPINETAGNLSILFYKPFINENLNSYDATANADKYKMIKSINIKNVRAKYKSEKLFYCPAKQFVDQTNQCTGFEAQIKTITNGSQTYKLCIDSDHRIGPESETGGFFTEEGCEQSCIEAQDCLPTYSSYTSITQANFKANVGCITSDENTACTVEKCKNLLGEDTRPTNEWITYNDDKRKQTVSNKVIDQTLTRPRFVLSDELALSESSNPDYNTIFQSEMKDTAFANMFKNSTYNTITYKIGQESPRRMSYYTELQSGQMGLQLSIKPESFKFDDGKTYNLYVIMELDQLYKPIAGTFIIDGQNIGVNRPEFNELQFQDKTFLIKTAESATANSWKVFKKIEFTSKKSNYDILRCENGKEETQKKGYFDNKIIPENCTVYPMILWADTPQLNIDRNLFYIPASDVFGTYDVNAETAPIFSSQEFSSNQIENNFNISNFLQLDIESAPGGLIRNQESQNYDLNFRKIYAGNFMGDTKRGWPYNYKLYAFYSDKTLTYKQVLENLKPENVFYEKVNPDKYPKKIKHDGDINNNIKPFIIGAPKKTTSNVEIMPYLNEEGQKAFKFMFLYDEANTSTGYVK